MERKNDFLVLKFGGTSVSSLRTWSNIAKIIQQRKQQFPSHKIILVCSAVSQVSNKLEDLRDATLAGNYDSKLAELKTIHTHLIQELKIPTPKLFDERIDSLEKIILGTSLLKDDSPKNNARILSNGEMLSTTIGHEFLNNIGITTKFLDARDILKTIVDDEEDRLRHYLNTDCDYSLNQKLIDDLLSSEDDVFITQGFIGSNDHGDTVLLGRGGSDVSAAYISAILNAKRLEIWTDAPGIFTANPKLIPTAKLLKLLDYNEAREIASAGAKILHPRTITPIQKSNIPLHIYSTFHPDVEGTVISGRVESDAPQIKAISIKSDTTVVSLTTLGMWQQVGFLADVFNTFKNLGLSIDQVSTSETSITITLDPSGNSMSSRKLSKLEDRLSEICKVNISTGKTTMSLLGNKVKSMLHSLAPVFKFFEEQKIYLLSHASSDLNLAFVIDSEQAEKLSQQFHEMIFQNENENPMFGPSWNELFSQPLADELDDSFDYWWLDKKDRLIEIAKENDDPAYVYHLPTVRDKAINLNRIESIDNILFAVKANNNIKILEILESEGIGFECVSLNEVKYVLENFPNIERKRILFTPNFSPENEYKEALELGINVTLDSTYPIEKWPETFKDNEIFVRIDTGIGSGHHKYVHTAGNASKFGVPPHEIEHLLELTEEHKIKIVGLHAHSGSGILNHNSWSKVASYLFEILKNFKDVRVLDLGGGLGVPEKIGTGRLDLEKLDASLKSFKEQNENINIWIEPGRYFVAECGVLVSQVTQVKKKGHIYYVGTTAGMNSLIRPALYGSHHEIKNITKLDEKSSITANIVGPICETGDVLGYSRKLPTSTESGDVLLIATAGAYGKVMSSSYTMRTPAYEVILE